MTTVQPTQNAYPATTQRTGYTTLSNALIITRREVRDSFRDWRIIVPITLMTIFFPFLAQWAASRISGYLSQYGAAFIGGQFIPFLLMIVGFFPISMSLVIALETFVGEKERRSLEPLLSTPISNTELYIGKTLAAMIPPLIASFAGMMVYLITLSIQTEVTWILPQMVVVQIFVLTIVQALVMVTGAVVVSSQATSTRAANLLASFIIIPMTFVINGEAIIIFVAPDAQSPTGIGALWVIVFGMIVTAALLLRVGNSIFNREELLGRMIDNLNLMGIFRKVWLYTRAIDEQGTSAKNLVEWYRKAIPFTLRQLRTSMLVTVFVFLVYFAVGYWIGTLPEFQLPIMNDTIAFESISTANAGATSENLTFLWIVVNNARIMGLALVLAAISFGVAAYIIMPPVFVVFGYLASQLVPVGYGAILAAAILPHGIIEIPIIIIGTAAIFRVGAIVTKPPQNMTVGEAWLRSLGGTVKIGIGVVLPGLIIAALIESTITIAIVQAILGNGL
jgi:uncharacterized membrane protein SpoIIM required for sporulation